MFPTIRPSVSGDKHSFAGLIFLSGMIVTCAGCRSSGGGSALRDLEHPEPLRRAYAVVAAGQRGDPSIAPLLVDRLEDEDAAVQAAAERALQRLLGERMIDRKPGETRFVWADRWRDQLRRNGRWMNESGHHVD